MELTDKELEAVRRALAWLRREYDCAYAIEEGVKGAEVAALTRAIKKLGGNPYPPPASRLLAGVDVLAILEGERNAEARQKAGRERIGFDLEGE